MVRQLRKETGETKGTIGRVADQLGCGVESLRSWVKQDEVDRGATGGVATAEAERIKVRENRELRRANAILKSARSGLWIRLGRRLRRLRRRVPSSSLVQTIETPSVIYAADQGL